MVVVGVDGGGGVGWFVDNVGVCCNAVIVDGVVVSTYVVGAGGVGIGVVIGVGVVIVSIGECAMDGVGISGVDCV